MTWSHLPRGGMTSWAAIVMIVLCGLVAIGPILGPGAAAFDKRYPPQGPPETCTDPEWSNQNPVNLPDEPGSPQSANHVEAVYSQVDNSSRYRVEFRVPNGRNASFQVGMEGDGAIVNVSGFQNAYPRFRWDGETEQPTLTVDANPPDAAVGNSREANRSYPHADGWLLAPAVDIHGGNVSVRPAASGAIGEQFIYLGNVSVHRNEVGCQEHVLIHPTQRSSDGPEPEAVLAALNESARRLHVGDADRTVRVFASPVVPNGNHSGWASLNEFVAPAEYEPSSPTRGHLWFHEYVHTRQDFTPRFGLQWFTEGSAQYLGLRLQLESGYISPREYDARLATYRYVPNGTSLNRADHSSTRSYYWGAALLSDLDHHLGSTNFTVGQLLRHLNARGSVRTRTASRWINRATQSTEVGAYSFRKQSFSTTYPNASYIMGPSWLSVKSRTGFASLEQPKIRASAGIVAIVFAILVWQTERAARGADD